MGRRPKPAALQAIRGNPRKQRKTPPAAIAPQTEAPPMPAFDLVKIVTLKHRARLVWDVMAPELERLNFLRSTDQPAFARYCDTLARYWKVSDEIDKLGSETYEAETTNGGKLARMRPQFAVMERLSRRLLELEDRFGLSPQARQTIIARLAAQMPQLPLTGGQKKDAPAKDVEQERQAPAGPPSPVGMLKPHGTVQ